MSSGYDSYYQTEDLFGEPYPELIAFFSTFPKKGKVLDLGCGQGRDSVAIASLGYEVVGIDNSKVGIAQMNQRATVEKLSIKGIVADIYQYEAFSDFDMILLDSMFHFNKNDLQKETDFVKKIIDNSKPEAVIIFCIQNTKNKVSTLNNTIDFNGVVERIHEASFLYKFKDETNGHVSVTDYKLIAVKK